MGAITDVPGVRVGQLTLGGAESDDSTCTATTVRTGVTCVLPGRGDFLRQPVTAGVHVINGYGKPLGLAQVAELGEIETPIILTNTLSVGAAHEGVVRHLLASHPELGRPATVNPVVLECNDGRLNDLRALAVRPEHVVEAIRRAEAEPEGHVVDQGAVGAGHGMVAFGWKGGIGTASRQVAGYAEGEAGGQDELDGSGGVDGVDGSGTLGVLVLTNMGHRQDFAPSGVRVASSASDKGREPTGAEQAPYATEQAPQTAEQGPEAAEPARHTQSPDGSVIVILATDAPWDARQLTRLARRAQNGLARTGVVTDHGSGEFVVAFSTARPRHRRDGDWMRPWFEAAADVVEEAVLSSMRAARTITGRDGVTVERCPHL